jgi:ABC-type nitrate/sulfonate/bicarbonate transport system substrate-binding protein
LYGGKGITDVHDLVGKTVAMTQAGSNADTAAVLFLRQYGLDKQVKRQAAASNEGIMAVLERGDVAGGVLTPPFNIVAEREGFKNLVDGPKLGVPYLQTGTAVSRDYLRAKPNIVRGFVQAYYDGWKFVVDPANKPAVLQSIMKWVKSDEVATAAAYDYVYSSWTRPGMPLIDMEGLKTVQSLSNDPKAREAKLDEYVDDSVLKAIAAGH